MGSYREIPSFSSFNPILSIFLGCFTSFWQFKHKNSINISIIQKVYIPLFSVIIVYFHCLFCYNYKEKLQKTPQKIQMSKIIYYIGAGASCGRKNTHEILDESSESERLIIHEGLPVVDEIAKSLLTFKVAVEEALIEPEKKYAFTHMFKYNGSVIIHAQMELLRDIDELYNACKMHATIDTYAKKLYLTKQYDELKRLKNILSVFFVWIQIEGNPDRRYDTFLANILQINNLYFPKEISVISWNYDSQFEIAYRNYNANDSLPIYEKNVDSVLPQLNESGKIFKVNGSARINNFDKVADIIKYNKIQPIILVIGCYEHLNVETSGKGCSHLSFAWETSNKQNQLMEAVRKTTADTESIVVIGYSFPFFNREIDRAIFEGMPNLKTIYIQDPNPEAVEQSLKAVLPDGSKARIEHQKDCTHFYLPREL